MVRLFSVLLVALLLMSPSLLAQEKEITQGRFGLTFPGLGALWHVTDQLAVLPGVSFSHARNSVSGVSDAGSSNGVTLLAGMRWYLHEWKGVRLFLSPKYQFGRNTSTYQTFSAYDNSIYTSTSTSHNHYVIGAWGLQYAITHRISAYGDIGAAYVRANTSNSNTLSRESHTNQVSTTGSWGLIFYLK